MHIDIFSNIGKTHQICEDYIIKGNFPFPFIILSDGCSSSKNTDVGARLLAISMKNAIESTYYPKSELYMPPFDYHTLGQTAISIAQVTSNLLNMNVDCLDATVIVAMVISNKVWIYMYGDGIVLYQEYIKELEGYVKVESLNGAPYYLSYLLDSARKKAYNKSALETEPNGEIIKITTSTDSLIGKVNRTLPYTEPLVFEYFLQEKPIIAIASDGLDSFVNITTGDKKELIDVVNDVMAFKNTEGEFVKRRLKKAIDTYGKEKIFPSDDVSFGAIIEPVITDAELEKEAISSILARANKLFW